MHVCTVQQCVHCGRQKETVLTHSTTAMPQVLARLVNKTWAEVPKTAYQAENGTVILDCADMAEKQIPTGEYRLIPICPYCDDRTWFPEEGQKLTLVGDGTHFAVDKEEDYRYTVLEDEERGLYGIAVTTFCSCKEQIVLSSRWFQDRGSYLKVKQFLTEEEDQIQKIAAEQWCKLVGAHEYNRDNRDYYRTATCTEPSVFFFYCRFCGKATEEPVTEETQTQAIKAQKPLGHLFSEEYFLGVLDEQGGYQQLQEDCKTVTAGEAISCEVLLHCERTDCSEPWQKTDLELENLIENGHYSLRVEPELTFLKRDGSWYELKYRTCVCKEAVLGTPHLLTQTEQGYFCAICDSLYAKDEVAKYEEVQNDWCTLLYNGVHCYGEYLAESEEAHAPWTAQCETCHREDVRYDHSDLPLVLVASIDGKDTVLEDTFYTITKENETVTVSFQECLKNSLLQQENVSLYLTSYCEKCAMRIATAADRILRLETFGDGHYTEQHSELLYIKKESEDGAKVFVAVCRLLQCGDGAESLSVESKRVLTKEQLAQEAELLEKLVDVEKYEKLFPEGFWESFTD